MHENAGLLLAVAGTALVMDLRSASVENGWILLSLFAGFVLRILQEGCAAILDFFAGAAVPLVSLSILFCFRMIGAGDIKLLSVLGGIMGVPDIYGCMFSSFLLGAVLSLTILISFGGFSRRIQYLIHYFQEYYHTGEVKPYYRKGMTLENIHFTVPVFFSVMLYAGGVY